jgi:hypothetical protein
MVTGNKRSFRRHPKVTGEKILDEAAIVTSFVSNLLEHRAQKDAASPVRRTATASPRSAVRVALLHRNLATKYALTVAYRIAIAISSTAGT